MIALQVINRQLCLCTHRDPVASAKNAPLESDRLAKWIEMAQYQTALTPPIQ